MKNKKKQILIVAIALLFAVSIYINISMKPDSAVQANEQPQEERLGEALFVNNEINPYFSEARINRQTSRDTSVEILNEVINNTTLSDDAKAKAAADIAEIVRQKEMESYIEELIKAKGFTECMAFANTETLNIVVQTSGETLSQSEAVQIRDIAINESKYDSDVIKIIEMKP